MPPETAAVWAEQLGDLQSPYALKALNTLIRTSPHFPAISEIRAAATAYTADDQRRNRVYEIEPVNQDNVTQIRKIQATIGKAMPT